MTPEFLLTVICKSENGNTVAHTVEIHIRFALFVDVLSVIKSVVFQFKFEFRESSKQCLI